MPNLLELSISYRTKSRPASLVPGNFSLSQYTMTVTLQALAVAGISPYLLLLVKSSSSFKAELNFSNVL